MSLETGKSNIEAIKQASPDLLAGLIVSMIPNFMVLMLPRNISLELIIVASAQTAFLVGHCFVAARVRRTKPWQVYVLTWAAFALLWPAMIAILDPMVALRSISFMPAIIGGYAIVGIVVDIIANAIQRSMDKSDEN